MDDREEIETKWREEFNELGEEGVREKFFRGTFQTNQRMEGFAYRWLGEKRKEQEEKNRAWRGVRVVLRILVVLVIAGGVIASWFFGLIPWPFWR